MKLQSLTRRLYTRANGREPAILGVAQAICSTPNPGLRRAVAEYLARERAYVQAAGEELAAAAPFRKDLIEQD